jgi:hypothetical protein
MEPTDGSSPGLLLPASTSPDDAEAQVERLRELVGSLLERNQQLERALASRIVIEQAKGVLAERHDLSVDEAFELLRRASRSHRMRIHKLAAAVVASRETPVEISTPSPARPHA